MITVEVDGQPVEIFVGQHWQCNTFPDIVATITSIDTEKGQVKAEVVDQYHPEGRELTYMAWSGFSIGAHYHPIREEEWF